MTTPKQEKTNNIIAATMIVRGGASQLRDLPSSSYSSSPGALEDGRGGRISRSRNVVINRKKHRDSNSKKKGILRFMMYALTQPIYWVAIWIGFLTISAWFYNELNNVENKKPLPRVLQIESIYHITPHANGQHHHLNYGLWNHGKRKIDVQNSSSVIDAAHDYYNIIESDEDITGCPYIVDWQKSAPNPTCNLLHEVGSYTEHHSHIQFLDSGAYNDVWKVVSENNASTGFVMKTGTHKPRYAYTPYYLHDYGHDARILEKATSSEYLLDIYAYCGSASLVEAASGTLGSKMKRIRNDLKPIDLLKYAYNVAQAVADMHLYHNGMPTVVSADVKTSQFLVIPGKEQAKVNDFNRGRFLTSKNPPEICPFTMGNHHSGSTNRSPEEYTDDGLQTDKVDVYSVGSMFYTFLTSKRPFYDVEPKKAMALIRDGKEVKLPDEIENSNDPSIKAIVQAMKWCRQFHAKDRPNSLEVAAFLKKELHAIENGLQKTS